jgi:serine/threonine protein kinase
MAAGLGTDHSTRGPDFFRTAARLGRQAAEELEHAHQLGVIHRDVKPANLLLDGRGNLWVADFGLAQVNSDARLTLTGDLVGTLRYMSPEQALAKRVPIDHRTDVYSLGASGGGEKEFVVCCHGQYAPDNTPLGLFMKAVAHSPLPADGGLFVKLEEIMDGQTQVEDVQQHFTVILPSAKGEQEVHFDALVLKGPVTDLVALRKLKLKRIDFRSCNLGKDVKMLGTLGRILGTQFITAPDVHMFYVPINPGRVLGSETAVYNYMAPVRSNTRTFPPDTELSDQRLDRAVIMVDEETFHTQVGTNVSSLEWFIDGWVMKVGSRYPRGSRTPVAFPLAGMIQEDDSKTPFVCPLESSYAGHIKTVRMPILVEVTTL